MKLETFTRRFVRQLFGDPYYEWPAFSLILGAGASRSAGIPLASEMVSLLRLTAELEKIDCPEPRRRETELSLLWRSVLSRVLPETEWSDPEREFLMGCISRADREANITHLVAMHFVSLGLLGPVVTTNFDDLTLAAYWNLPYQSARREPHIIYDPLTSSAARPRVAAGVPVIIKAHGHHTTYGLGILDKQIKQLAGHVHETLRNLRKPHHGYMVVGYSGAWADGVMEALGDRDLVKDKFIYWFHRGAPPCGPALDRIAKKAALQFIQISDSDALFLNLWREAAWAEVYNLAHLERGTLFGMNIELLFSNPPAYPSPRKFSKEQANEWWKTPIVMRESKAGPPYERLVALRRELIPLLKRIEAWDDRCMVMDCLPSSHLRKAADARGYPSSWYNNAPDLELLRESVPVDIQWTRRNRKLLRLALNPATSEVTAYDLMGALMTNAR